jgi:L-aspartate oxidase
LQYNIDITTNLVPVRPSAHYAMGGVATDLHGATSLEGLYAAGEVAATGVHGANRLASNSLLEGLVYGARCASAMTRSRPNPHPRAPARTFSAAHPGPTPGNGQADLEKVLTEVRSILWEKVGVIRNGKELCEAVKRLEAIALPEFAPPSRQFYEAQNILEVGRLIAGCALERKESRGAHYRVDYPLKITSSPPRHSYVSRDKPVYFE